MIARVCSLPDQTEERTKVFLKWKSIDLSSELSLTYGGNVMKVFIILFLLVRIGNINSFQSKSISSAFN